MAPKCGCIGSCNCFRNVLPVILADAQKALGSKKFAEIVEEKTGAMTELDQELVEIRKKALKPK